MSNLLKLYPVPNEQESEEQADRFHGHDVASCTDEDLRRELTFLRLLNFLEDSAWHLEREVMVKAEMRRRTRRSVPRTL